MNQFPHQPQPAPGSSGLTCLHIICKYYKVFQNWEDLKDIASKRKKELSVLTLRETSESLGFRTKIIQLNLNDLKIIFRPCILYLNEEHFVVLYKIKKKNYYISDPKLGLTRYNETQFHALGSKSGAALCILLEPKHDISKKDKGISIKSLLYYLKPYKKLLIQVMLAFFAGSMLSLVFPLMTQIIVDVGIVTANVHLVILILIAQTILIISQAIIEFIRNWVLLNVSLRIMMTLISDFLVKLMRLPMSFFEKKLIGDIRQRIDDNARIQQFLTTNVVGMLFGIFVFLIYSVVITFYNRYILLIYYVGTAVYLLWVFAFLKRRRILDAKRFHEAVSDQNKVYEMLTGMQDIKLNGWEEQKRNEWEFIKIKLLRISLQSLKLGQFQNIGAITIAQIVNLTISFITVTSVIKGEITLGGMVAIQFLIGQLNGPIHDLIQFITSAQDTKFSLERIREINSQKDESNETPSEFELPSDHSITINDLSFGYSETSPILKNVNLKIPGGKITAIVGESGSGKTTLLKLILRYFEVKKEEIKIGETSLADLDISIWRNACGAVMQEGIIFSDTILNNISLNHDNTNTEQLEYAVHIANIKEFLEELPMGYKTIIGQGAQNLSQGQKQRLLIARAVYRNPAFLFFDEATNALDSNNETIIVERLSDFFVDRTVIIVAHRLSTVKNADQIVVLNKGNVVETGDHKSLLELRGHYYSLVKNQLEI